MDQRLPTQSLLVSPSLRLHELIFQVLVQTTRVLLMALLELEEFYRMYIPSRGELIGRISSNTGLPSDFGSFSAPSLAPFPGIATGSGTVISPTASSGSSISTSTPASSFSGSGSIASATSTGLRNGGEPVNGVTPNSGFAVGHPSILVFGGMIAFVWVWISV
jgi:hypothetical protein